MGRRLTQTLDCCLVQLADSLGRHAYDQASRFKSLAFRHQRARTNEDLLGPLVEEERAVSITLSMLEERIPEAVGKVDVVRHRLVQQIVEAYEEHSERSAPELRPADRDRRRA